MTPKEKAEELLNKFNNPDRTNYPYVHNAQQCALIAVHEILYNVNVIWGWDAPEKYNFRKYWQEVKQEIEKL
jgi:hypothetical protein